MTHSWVLSAIINTSHVSFVEGALNHSDFSQNIDNSQAHSWLCGKAEPYGDAL